MSYIRFNRMTNVKMEVVNPDRFGDEERGDNRSRLWRGSGPGSAWEERAWDSQEEAEFGCE